MFKSKQKPNRLFFDEIVPDVSGRHFSSLERPVTSGIFYLALIAVFGLVLALFGRLFYLNVIRGTFYQNRSETNVNRTISVPAPRGLITDRFGVPLVENQPSFSINLNLVDFFRESDESRAKIISALSSIFSLDEAELVNRLSKINLETSAELLVARDVGLDQAVEVRGLNLKSVSVIDDYRRHYLAGPAFSHILGYVGEVTQAELEADSSLRPGDTLGKSGLEYYYDSLLRGSPGQAIFFRDAEGRVIDTKKISNPVSGETLRTTIDAEFQQAFHNFMFTGLTNLGRQAGVGLAVNPQNGEVLAALSFPSFDNNAFSDSTRSADRSILLNSSYQPLFNRFVSGLYNPGSTIKPMVALAGLVEGVITPANSFYSAGYIEVPNPYFPDQPSRFLDWKAHGWVDVYSALARSSNVYFYYVGGGFEDFIGLGIDRLNDWWRRFGFDATTGIDLPHERSGFLPNPSEKELRTDTPWRVGDTYNVSIGQGDIAITPLELISYISAIANDGIAYNLHLALSDSTASFREVVIDVSKWQSELSIVQTGMEHTVTKDYGTAHLLNTLPFKVAAKTGSAQVEGNSKTNAFIVAYAPAENPVIALLVLVEDAKEGSLNAVPIANQVLYWYYTHRLNTSN